MFGADATFFPALKRFHCAVLNGMSSVALVVTGGAYEGLFLYGFFLLVA
jgi:hypothetical protein